MRKTDIAGIAFGNFKRRKTRSILSVLGVVIGTASIVTMMSLGIAVNVNFQEQLKSYGNINQISVYSGYDDKTGKRKPLTDETVAQLRGVENVTTVTPLLNLNGNIFCGKYRNYNSIMGIDMDYLHAVGTTMSRGAMITDENVDQGKTIHCLMGASVPYQFSKPQRAGGGMAISMGGGNGELPPGYEVPEGGYFYDGQIYDEKGNTVGTYPPEIDPMDENNRIKYTYDWNYGQTQPGQTLTAGNKAKVYNLKTVGILGRGNDDYMIYIDMDSAIKLKKEADKWQQSQNQSGGAPVSSKKEEFSYDQVYVLTDNIKNTLEVTEQIKAMGFQAHSSADWISTMQETQNMLQMVLAGIGGVSLLVAAIGITNTMVMSIYERTREIGIMKCIGCYLKDIRTLFLTEAGFIGLFGGLFGIGLSYGVSALLNWAAASGQMSGGGGMGGIGGGTVLSVIPWWLALAAVGFAILVALVSGFFPARRAMRLSALTAMQN